MVSHPMNDASASGLMPWNPIPPSIHYYFDESSFEPGHDFAAVGGLAVPSYYHRQIERQLFKIKHDCGLEPERNVKWNKTCGRRNCPQTAYAEYLALLVENKIVNLHIIFVPIKSFDNRANGGREGSIGRIFNELLIFRPLKFYGPYTAIHLRPDRGSCTAGISAHLNNAVIEAANRERGGYLRAKNIELCVKTFEPVNSKFTPLLQLLDVTLGAFTALREGRDTNKPKVILANKVHALYGRPNLTQDIGGKNSAIFSLWNFEGRGPKKQIGFLSLRSPSGWAGAA